MSRKRTLPDVYRSRKRVCAAPANHSGQEVLNTNGVDWNDGESSNHIDNSIVPNDTSCALAYLKNLFPVEKFEGRLPPVILQHQLYAIVTNRTVVDQQLMELRNSGKIKLFKLGTDASEFCVLFTEDYKSHVRKFIQNMSLNQAVIERFLTMVVDQCQDISLSKHKLMTELKFKDDEITQLVKACVLTVRDVGSWWMAFPGAGIFMKSFIRGRKAVLMMIRKCKYKEIIREELKSRKLPRIARLGMEYHIHDLIGADLVEWYVE